jgi:murein DD-endopeptidase MepM/ murein hydrolase activator NlpD
MPAGLPALSLGPGVVRTAKPTSTGDYVSIDHPGGYRSEYMHLRNLRVSKGQQVEAGQPIGTVSFNPADFNLIHLHFQLRKNGALIDPRPLI